MCVYQVIAVDVKQALQLKSCYFLKVRYGKRA